MEEIHEMDEGEERDEGAALPGRIHVLNAFLRTPWAILPEQLAVLEEIVLRHVAGEKLSAEEIHARTAGAARPAEARRGAVAVLPVFGTIVPRADLLTEVSGATSAERLGRRFDELMQDPQVDAVVLDVNSPGGQVWGVQELSQQIFEARGAKPVIAVAQHLMASAAYWIGSAADEIVMTPSAEAGAIGVFAVHQDLSVQLANRGIRTSLISAGRYKVEGNPFEPLGEEARAAIQASVNENYAAFVGSVARNRGVGAEQVRAGFGEGRLVSARQAVEMGMADRIGSVDQVVRELLSGYRPAARQAVGAVSLPLQPEASSDPGAADREREAQRLRDYVQVYR